MQIVLRMKGDMRMNILNDILEKEGDNRGFVYLYYLALLIPFDLYCLIPLVSLCSDNLIFFAHLYMSFFLLH